MTSVIESRQRLDKTLLSPALTDTPILSNLVRKKLQISSPGKVPSDRVVEEKSKQLSTLLDALRSAQGERTVNNDHGEWKVKQDNSRYRVMYREGPAGTPFHSLCLEGIIDGPMSHALVVGWEVPLYKEWWPQFTAPAFKIVESRWLQKGTVGGELSVLRFKVPWPIAMREVVLSSYELDYFDEDLLVVLYNSAPEAPDEDIDGISPDELPKPLPNAVRMDLHGGFVLQKINSNCNFFRCVVDMDMKLDLVPPWLINFIARQLIGHGYKLYQKAVTAVKDSPFEKLVNSEPMYKRIQGAIECSSSPNLYEPTLLPMVPLELDKSKIRELFKQEDLNLVETAFKNLSDLKQASTDHSLEDLHSPIVPAQEDEIATDKLPVADICPPVPSEIAPINGTSSPEGAPKIALLSPQLQEKLNCDIEASGTSDPEVLWALQVLNKLIAHFNAQKSNSQTNGRAMQTVPNGEVPNEPVKIGKPQGRDHNTDEGDRSSLQNPTLEPIMYNTNRVQTEVALDKAKAGPILTNGSFHGNHKQANHLIATGLPTISGIVMNGKINEGKHYHDEENHHHIGAHSHHSYFGYRLFRPFRLRKKQKEGKHSKKIAEAVAEDATSKSDSDL